MELSFLAKKVRLCLLSNHGYKETNRQGKFRTVVSEVSSFPLFWVTLSMSSDFYLDCSWKNPTACISSWVIVPFLGTTTLAPTNVFNMENRVSNLNSKYIQLYFNLIQELVILENEFFLFCNTAFSPQQPLFSNLFDLLKKMFERNVNLKNFLSSIIFKIKQDIRIYMFPLACQTAGPIGLKFF